MSETRGVETRYVQRGEINMRLVLNHTHGHVRFMDYRVGSYEQKRDALDELARSQGLRKAFTLVEKQDSRNWRAVGFMREGVYPQFFRTADAYAMSRLYDDAGMPIDLLPATKQSGADQLKFPGRKLNKPAGLELKIIVDERVRRALVPRLERRIPPPPMTRQDLPDLVLHARATAHEGYVIAEIDESFGHATVGFAPTPQLEADLVLSAYAGHDMIARLAELGVSNVFGYSPCQDQLTNELYTGLGFRATGRLAQHLMTSDGPSTAIVWHRRI